MTGNPSNSKPATTRPLARRLLPVGLVLTLLVVGLAPNVVAKEPGCKPNEHASSTAQNLCAEAGDLLDVRIGDLHPTQAVLGFQEVYYKLGRYEAGKDVAAGGFNKRFDDYCESNGQEKAAWANSDSRLDDASSFGCTIPVGSETQASIDPMKTAVIGHGGRLYLVDGHHTFTAFQETADGGPDMHIRVRILGNLANEGPDAFWDDMQANGWVWLRDENNQPITVDQLPDHLGLSNFRNDDYRGLVYFTRDVAYTQNAENANFQEFYWGDWLRSNPNFDLASYDLTDHAGYLAAVKAASKLMSGLHNEDPVAGGFTAGDLGRIDFKTSEFTKLSKDYCNAKPGKIAYAFYYEHNMLGQDVTAPCS